MLHATTLLFKNELDFIKITYLTLYFYFFSLRQRMIHQEKCKLTYEKQRKITKSDQLSVSYKSVLHSIKHVYKYLYTYKMCTIYSVIWKKFIGLSLLTTAVE